MTENFDLDTGKNIVEALKQQAEEDSSEELFETEENAEADVEQTEDSADFSDFHKENDEPIETFDASIKTDNDFFSAEPTHAVVEKYAEDLYNFEVPNNVAVLKKLISKLPSGVTRQTGAQIIKQTMEALGISIKSVLQEAQQLQDQLNNSAKECQATIQEYKRQIATLEEQSQSYKKQYSNLNELVSLFIQTDN